MRRLKRWKKKLEQKLLMVFQKRLLKRSLKNYLEYLFNSEDDDSLTDDYGMSKGVNLGIIEAHKNGIVTSTTLMITMPEVANALPILLMKP